MGFSTSTSSTRRISARPFFDLVLLAIGTVNRRSPLLGLSRVLATTWPDASIQPPWPRLLAGLVGCLVLGLALRLVVFSGFTGSDDISYASIAHEMAGGTFRIHNHPYAPVFPLRLTVVAPLALL